MACGTGACAASIVSASKELTNNKVKEVSMPGGKLKLVNQPEKKSILLTGPAAKCLTEN